MMRPFLLLAAAGLLAACAQQPLRGTGDLGVVVERATGSLQIIESSTQSQLARVEGLGVALPERGTVLEIGKNSVSPSTMPRIRA